jgi:hypothetical protein
MKGYIYFYILPYPLTIYIYMHAIRGCVADLSMQSPSFNLVVCIACRILFCLEFKSTSSSSSYVTGGNNLRRIIAPFFSYTHTSYNCGSQSS